MLTPVLPATEYVPCFKMFGAKGESLDAFMYRFDFGSGPFNSGFRPEFPVDEKTLVQVHTAFLTLLPDDLKALLANGVFSPRPSRNPILVRSWHCDDADVKPSA